MCSGIIGIEIIIERASKRQQLVSGSNMSGQDYSCLVLAPVSGRLVGCVCQLDCS